MALNDPGEFELAVHSLLFEGLGIQAGVDDGRGGLGGDGLGEGDIAGGEAAFVPAVKAQQANGLVLVDETNGERTDETLPNDVLAVAGKERIGAHVLDDDGFAPQGALVELALAGGDGALVDVGVTKAVCGRETQLAGVVVE